MMEVCREPFATMLNGKNWGRGTRILKAVMNLRIYKLNFTSASSKCVDLHEWDNALLS